MRKRPVPKLPLYIVFSIKLYQKNQLNILFLNTHCTRISNHKNNVSLVNLPNFSLLAWRELIYCGVRFAFQNYPTDELDKTSLRLFWQNIHQQFLIYRKFRCNFGLVSSRKAVLGQLVHHENKDTLLINNDGLLPLYQMK